MISCEKAAILINKVEYNEASLWDKVTLNLHMFICKACTGFSKKNAQFTALFKKANIKTLSEQEKLKMKKQLQDYL